MKNITFRSALAISFSLHLLVLSPWSAFRFVRVEDKKNLIEVTYILEKIAKEKIEKEIKKLPQKYGLEKKELKKAKQKEKEPKETKTAPLAEPLKKEGSFLKEEEMKKSEEYIAYYELIREKIKKYVTRYYTRTSERGRIGVVFKLNKKGVLQELNLVTAGNYHSQYLDKIALKAVKSASPFPPFPEALKKEELTFTVSIIFRK